MRGGSRRAAGAFVAVLVLFVCGGALIHFGKYGWTIFVALPVLLGAMASLLFRPEDGGHAAALGAGAVTLASFTFLFIGIEGLYCIFMTLPLGVPLGMIGSWLVYELDCREVEKRGVIVLLLLPLATFTFDMNARPDTFEVHSSIEIAATPEQVWKHVVTFSELPEPDEWYFRAGLAYPKRARIVGTGTGAIRYCEFSTGPFVEPIEIWNEPRLLSFRVTENPAPMHEWSPYAEVLPKHLHGYLISKHGEFRLTPLAGGRTLLEGSTQYQHGLWPATYWRWWSDAIIHRIHMRVLNHIRALAEAPSV